MLVTTRLKTIGVSVLNGPRYPLPDSSREAEKATCLTETHSSIENKATELEFRHLTSLFLRLCSVFSSSTWVSVPCVLALSEFSSAV